MKLIIDIDDRLYNDIRNCADVQIASHEAIKNGIPYEERPHGEWIIRRNNQGTPLYIVCSKCNVPCLETGFPKFCRNCGSDNRKRGEAK
jgi:hypothetical protein